MQPNPDGPYRLRYEDLDNGTLETRGFPTNAARFDWVATTRGIRPMEYLNPEPDGTESAVPATTPDETLAEQLSFSSAGRKLLDEFDIVDLVGMTVPDLPDWVEPVSAWVTEHENDLVNEANRREMTVPEFLVHMLADILAVYQDTNDLDVAEELAEAKYAKARDDQMHAVDPNHQCEPEMLKNIIAYGAPGYGYAGVCGLCGLQWSLVGGALYAPADGAHILRPEDVR